MMPNTTNCVCKCVSLGSCVNFMQQLLANPKVLLYHLLTACWILMMIVTHIYYKQILSEKDLKLFTRPIKNNQKREDPKLRLTRAKIPLHQINEQSQIREDFFLSPSNLGSFVCQQHFLFILPYVNWLFYILCIADNKTMPCTCAYRYPYQFKNKINN